VASSHSAAAFGKRRRKMPAGRRSHFARNEAA
jgi:hypothetical protein